MKLSETKILLAAMVVATPLSLLVAASSHELTYPEGPGRTGDRRPPAVRSTVPQELRMQPGPAATVEASAHDSAARTRPGPDRSPQGARGRHDARQDDLQRQARRAARWAAKRLATERGGPEYYRAGFQAGMQTALEDRRAGLPQFDRGARAAWRELAPVELGRSIGIDDAERLAVREAAIQVAAQFRDLSREPRFTPRVVLPIYEPPPIDTAAPKLRDVFRGVTPVEIVDDRRFHGELHDVSAEAWDLYRCATPDEFFDGDWAAPRAAFDLWLAERRSRAYDDLRSERLRAAFRAAFDAELSHNLHDQYHEILEPAYDGGFDHGWEYGAWALDEWQWRRGYRSGFAEAALAAAREVFAAEYPAAVRRSYSREFAEWTNNPRPDVRVVSLIDGNDDGVFQPGESLRVNLELVNYGGRSGSFPMRLSGAALTAPAEALVDLPPRGVVRDDRMLAAWIGEGVAPRTRGELRFELGTSLERSLELTVSNPLQFTRSVAPTRRDSLAGTVEVSIAFRNQSRLPVVGAVELTSAELPGFGMERDLGSVTAGGADSTRFVLEGLDPLQLIAGEITLDVALWVEGKRYDSMRYTLPGTAGDLDSSDLPRLLLRQARDTDAAPERISRARDLLLLRLSEDWKVAVRARGNPYKHDFKRNSAQTALGELVRLYLTQRHDLRRPEVFANLESEIRTLADRLPGAHPLLRKYVRKLSTAFP